MKIDRRDIAPFMLPIFPSMAADASSDDWHGFLNAMSGLDIALDEDNSSAFDKWRIKLADMGYPTWDYSPTHLATIETKGAEFKAAEEKRIANLAATLVDLNAQAPSVSAADLLQAKPTL